MMKTLLRWPAAVLLAFGLVQPAPVTAQPAVKTPWVLDDVLKDLRHAPNDPYLQYVAAQLARRDGKVEQVLSMIDPLGPAPNPRGRSTDLFSTFTGALAIQESLQLDTLLGQPAVVKDDTPTVKVSTLTGPSVQSHPWEKMLGAKRPDVGPFANCVPHDYYLAEFRTVGKLTEAMTVGNVWSNHVFAQMLGQSRSELTMERIRAQLGLLNLPAAVVDRLGVEGVAVTGSDLFLAEGSDVTVLVRGPNVAALADAIAEMSADKLKAENGTHAGIAYRHQRTADGKTDVYLATPNADLHVRGTSLPAFRRVLEAIAGQGTKRLGETAEYRYVRSLMPRGGPEEDGFLYLSDAFIRKMVGAQLKLTERRRLLAYNHLRMIGHACLMFRTEFGRAPQSLAELAEARCAPGVFGDGALARPDGGAYSLAADGMSGVCSRFGTTTRLTPCVERLLTEVSEHEATQYTAFVKDYEQYWRTYFDPIAVRVQVTPEKLRLETLILPLIDNSIYTELARALGGKPVAFDAASVAKSCIGSLYVRVNKEPYLAKLKPADDPRKPAAASATVTSNDLKEMALAMHNYHDVTGAFPAAAIRDAQGKTLLSWRVAILPYLEQGQLYKEFKLDEPWDSTHNKKLFAKMPKVYHGGSKEAIAAGKTVYKVPVGKDTIFPPGGKGTKILDITDGTSNTVMILTVPEADAVEWTKPDDWELDPKKPTRGLAQAGRDAVAVVMADGRVQRLPLTLGDKNWLALFTRNGGEVIDFLDPPPAGGPNGTIFGVPAFNDFFSEIDDPAVRRFLTDGIGDHVGVHMFDESRLLDFDFSAVLGGAANNAFGLSGRDRLGLSMAIQMLIRPTAISVPVKDAKVVDEALETFDRWAVESAETAARGSRNFLPIGSEFYRVKFPAPHVVRCSAVKFFGFKVRFFYGRIGDGLYVANRPFVLEDIAANVGAKPAVDAEKGNVMLRIRPENWNRVLPGYRLGWAENDREACQANFSTIAAVGRGWNDRATTVDDKLLARIGQVYGVRPQCPEGGKYTLTPDGKECACSVHGTWRNPTQPAAPTAASAAGKLMHGLTGVTATLTFQDDGLRAVVTVNRKP